MRSQGLGRWRAVDEKLALPGTGDGCSGPDEGGDRSGPSGHSCSSSTRSGVRDVAQRCETRTLSMQLMHQGCDRLEKMLAVVEHQ